MKSLFDMYSLKARVFPAILVIFPLALALGSWAPNVELPKIVLFGIAGNLALGFFIAELVQTRGVKKQAALWKSWGGPPTTQLLRHRNTEVSRALREDWHRGIEKVIGRPLPSAASESRVPEKADDAYGAAVLQLRDKTRDEAKHPLVFKTNMSYGFRRNLWAMKPAGIFTALLGFAGCFAKIVASNLDKWTFEAPSSTASVICLMLLVWWISAVTSSWVKSQAFEYGTRLLGAVTMLVEAKEQGGDKNHPAVGIIR
jgi:hypothetical protein